MIKEREVKDRKRSYWVYRVIEFVGVLMVLFGVFYLIGLVGKSDVDDMLREAVEPLSYYIVRIVLSMSIIVLGLLIRKFGIYRALVQRGWLNKHLESGS